MEKYVRWFKPVGQDTATVQVKEDGYTWKDYKSSTLYTPDLSGMSSGYSTFLRCMKAGYTSVIEKSKKEE